MAASTAKDLLPASSSGQRSQPVVFLCDDCHDNGDQRKDTASLAGLRVAVSRHLNQGHAEPACDRLRERSLNSGEIYAFLGVPYAEIPERFAQPRPLDRKSVV